MRHPLHTASQGKLRTARIATQQARLRSSTFNGNIHGDADDIFGPAFVGSFPAGYLVHEKRPARLKKLVIPLALRHRASPRRLSEFL